MVLGVEGYEASLPVDDICKSSPVDLGIGEVLSRSCRLSPNNLIYQNDRLTYVIIYLNALHLLLSEVHSPAEEETLNYFSKCLLCP